MIQVWIIPHQVPHSKRALKKNTNLANIANCYHSISSIVNNIELAADSGKKDSASNPSSPLAKHTRKSKIKKPHPTDPDDFDPLIFPSSSPVSF